MSNNVRNLATMDVHVSLYALTVSTRRFVVIRGVEIPVARFNVVGLFLPPQAVERVLRCFLHAFFMPICVVSAWLECEKITITILQFMEQKNYFKLFCAIAFVAFAAVSCWATVESLHLLLSAKDKGIPVIFVWIVTVGFYFIASLGSKMIVDSLNSNVYTENPGLKLCGGIFIMIIFWLLMSMPTNTHTFFYKDNIKEVAIRDLVKTDDYLRMLETDEFAIATIEHDWAVYENEVWGVYEEIRNEVANPSRPGMAEYVENLMLKLDGKLEVKVGRVKPRTNNVKGWNEVLEIYRRSIETILEKKKQEYISRFIVITPETKKKIKTFRKNISKVLKDIHNMKEINDEVMVNASTALTDSYSLINEYSNHVEFKDDDKQVYAGNKQSKTERMLDVWAIWMDFFKGKIAQGKFVFWMIISILIDVAGFIFFDIAFKKEN